MSQPEQSGVRRGCKPSAITNMADAAGRGWVEGGGGEEGTCSYAWANLQTAQWEAFCFAALDIMTKHPAAGTRPKMPPLVSALGSALLLQNWIIKFIFASESAVFCFFFLYARVVFNISGVFLRRYSLKCQMCKGPMFFPFSDLLVFIPDFSRAALDD